jgi:hypothetical protein
LPPARCRLHRRRYCDTAAPVHVPPRRRRAGSGPALLRQSRHAAIAARSAPCSGGVRRSRRPDPAGARADTRPAPSSQRHRGRWRVAPPAASAESPPAECAERTAPMPPQLRQDCANATSRRHRGILASRRWTRNEMMSSQWQPHVRGDACSTAGRDEVYRPHVLNSVRLRTQPRAHVRARHTAGNVQCSKAHRPRGRHAAVFRS